MRQDRDGIQVRLLGAPAVLANGFGVEFPTRKSAALLFHIAAHAGRRIDRRRLSGLLWSDSDPALAAASLRRALTLLGASPATRDLVGRDRNTVWFAGDPARTDLAAFNRCLAAGTEKAYRKAVDLWGGEPLAGLELGVDLFDEWVSQFRADTVETAHRLLSDRLSALPVSSTGGSGLEIALCELIARIEPTDTAANARMIRALAERGDTAAATRRFRAFSRALEELDVPVPSEIARYVEGLAHAQAPPSPGTAPTRRQERPPQEPPARILPTLAVLRPHASRPLPDLFAFAHSELLVQLTRFRTWHCIDADDVRPPDANVPHVRHLSLSDVVDHDYRLVLWDQPEQKVIYLRCVNTRRQHTVSCHRLHHEELADKAVTERTIARAINSIEQDILNDHTTPQDTVFGRWLEAYRHISQFSRKSDETALGILEELAADEHGRRMGRVHAAIASILMIQRLIVPLGGERDRDNLDRARDCVNTALAMDQLEPFSHVMLGWLRVQSGDHERALAAFDTALRLNPYSSSVRISAAEAHAFCGNIDRAVELANAAESCFGYNVPPYLHGYFANIAYLAGDLGRCIDHLEKAPDNLHLALLGVAVHQERGDKRAAAQARVRFEQELRRAQPEIRLDGHGITHWIETATLIRGDATRRRLFSSLEEAGVMNSVIGRPLRNKSQRRG